MCSFIAALEISGLPVVAGDIGGLKDTVRHHWKLEIRSGFLVPKDEVKEFVEKMGDMCEEAGGRAKPGRVVGSTRVVTEMPDVTLMRCVLPRPVFFPPVEIFRDDGIQHIL